jgi:pimeloyl-ACP methyl ester carboxylesterase
MDEFEIPAGELTFRAVAAGPEEGELVVLLHGFPQTSHAYRRVLPALAEAGYRAVAFDQRGYSPGARPAEVEAYAVPHLVADVLAVADWIGGHTFHLVGHDWGGAVAWQVAGRYPQRLRTLTVLSTPHPHAFSRALRGEDGGGQRERSGYMDFFRSPEAEDVFLADDAAGLRNLYLASGLTEEQAAPYVAVLGERAALTAALGWYRAGGIGMVEGLGPVTTPTLYVWSTDDPALGREAAEATAGCVEGPYRFEVLEGVSHWIPEHATDRLNGLLVEHLGSTHGQGG